MYKRQVVYSLIYNALSISLGLLLVKVFKLPSWATPAITFNNTISFPLLLTQSLQSTGVLDNLLMCSNDDVSSAVTRAKSYFLVNAMIADSLTFGLGPRLLESSHTEDAPDKKEGQEDDDDSPEAERRNEEEDEEQARETEETSLLPNKAVRKGVLSERKIARLAQRGYYKLPSWMQSALAGAWSFVSPPLIGATIGVIIGLVPALQTAFFAESQDGGFLNAWLTKSVENIGELFTALQVVVVGVKLSKGSSSINFLLKENQANTTQRCST